MPLPLISRPHHGRYDWLFLRTVVSLGYLGWIAYTFVFMLRAYSSTPAPSLVLKTTPAPSLVLKTTSAPSLVLKTTSAPSLVLKSYYLAAALAVALTVYLAAVSAPALYYVYVAFPLFFWANVVADAPLWLAAFAAQRRQGRTARVAGAALLFAVAMEVLVATYFERDILTAIFWVFAAWPLTWPRDARRRLGWIGAVWAALCIVTGLFTHLPVVSDQVPSLVYVRAFSTHTHDRPRPLALPPSLPSALPPSLPPARPRSCATSDARRRPQCRWRGRAARDVRGRVRHPPPLDRLERQRRATHPGPHHRRPRPGSPLG